MASPQVTFTPSVTARFQAKHLATVVDLPPVDPSNSAVVIQNGGPGTLAIVAAAAAGAGSLFDAPRHIVLQPSKARLVFEPGLVNGTMASVQASSASQCEVTFMRGSTEEVWLFPAPAAAVI